MAQVIRMPIELDLQLKNLKSQVGTLQNMLNSVKPNTAIYDSLHKAIGKLDNEFISLINRANQGFTSQSQITHFEESVRKAVLGLQNLFTKMGNLKYEDLAEGLFSDDDLARIREAEQAIKSYGDAKKKANAEAFKVKVSPETKKLLTELSASFNVDTASLESGLQVLNKGFNAAQNNIESTKEDIQELKKELEGLNLQELQQDSKKKNSAAERIKRDANTKRISAKVAYNKLDAGKLLELTQPSKGTYNIDNRLREAITQKNLKDLNATQRRAAIKAVFDAMIEEIKAKETEAINAAKEADENLKQALNSSARLEGKIGEKETFLNQQESDKARIEAAQLDIGEAQTALPQLIQKYEQELKGLREELAQVKQDLANLRGVSEESAEGSKKAGEGLEEFSRGAQTAADSAKQAEAATQRLASIQSAIKQWFGFNEVINLTKRAVRDAISHIRELDAVMTEIAVVTDMTQAELWDQIDTYSAMAQQYGVTTVGVYQVSQLWAQQGIEMNQVLSLTEETLKMAKIADLDYADATDYMTSALRGFKLELTDAQSIVDVYSNLAAITASDTEELAVAMSKTASSAEAVGSSFENTSAMIALMVETTREAPKYFWVTKK